MSTWRGPGKRGMAKMMALLDGKGVAHPPYAPPFLKAGKLVVAQTAEILFFLGPRLKLAPRDEAGRLWAHQLQLTITDLVVRIHDTHHPVSGWLYFEEQRPAAKRRTKDFWRYQVPKMLGYFERVLQKNGGKYAVGRSLSYVDLSLFQIVEGMRYAFPETHEALREENTGAGRAARPRGGAAADKGLSRLEAAHPVQPMGHLPLFQGARRVGLLCRGCGDGNMETVRLSRGGKAGED